MGVHGLWQLLNSVGRPVTLESLENKILAIDVSIWLHQAVKGCKNSAGAPAANAHLLTLFNRICKLLFYKIKPVFVFDGGIPLLKKQTVAARRQRKETATKESHRTLQKLLTNIIKKDAIKKKINSGSQEECGQEIMQEIMQIVDSTNATKQPDLFQLPSLPTDAQTEFDKINQDSSDEDTIQDIFQHYLSSQYQDIGSVNVNSESFNGLPLDIQHEILSELKESRKRNSWAQMDQMPKDSFNFSSFQMARLKLEAVEKEMRNVEIDYIPEDLDGNIAVTSRRILSEEGAHYILTRNSNSSNQIANHVMTVVTPQQQEKHEQGQSLSQKQTGIDVDDILSTSSNDSVEILQRVVENYSKKCHNESDEHPRHLISLREEMPSFSFNTATNSELINISPELCHAGMSSQKNSQKMPTNISYSSGRLPEPIDNNNRENNLNNQSHFDNNEISKPSTSEVHAQPMNHFTPANNIEKIFDYSHPGSSTSSNLVSFPSAPDQADTDDSDFIEVPSLVDLDSDSSINEIKQTDETFVDLNPIDMETYDTPVNEAKEMSLEELKKLETQLDAENVILQKEKAQFDGAAKSLADQTYGECQELLKLFGIPYIISPMEAEAQCAKLDLLNLTHGTITDDSDVWLFGGERVYRNFFNQSKFVEFFKSSDIREHFNLDRLKLICLALMTGSDYTVGVEGVGCVTAMEVLSEFSEDGLECLKAFKKWWEENKTNVSTDTPVRKKLRKLVLPPGFPNDAIAKAYLEPAVDDSREGFSWSKPDLAALREYAQFRFGWPRSKADDLLLPVLKKLNTNESQTRLDSFFKVTLKKELQPLASKRLKRAIRKVTRRNSPQVEVEDNRKKAVRILQGKMTNLDERIKNAPTKRKAKPKESKGKKLLKPQSRLLSTTVDLSEDSSD
uniref:XPG-I domain-containing protein n=1 Tax=Strigamia maritima TaxID=126957 RepID=T1JMN9_STRMM